MKYGKIIEGNVIIKKGCKDDFSEVEKITGYLYINSDAKLEAPQLQSVGGSLYIYSDAKLEAPQAKFNIEGTAEAAAKFNFECFLNLGYLFADRMLAKLINRKKIGNSCVYKIQLAGQTKISYCIEVDGTFSHGDTIKEAKESLMFKISDRDTSMYNNLTLDSEITLAEGIQMYRKITGACEPGTRHFVNHMLTVKKDKYTIKEIIELTDGQYNCEKLQEFFRKEVQND